MVGCGRVVVGKEGLMSRVCRAVKGERPMGYACAQVVRKEERMGCVCRAVITSQLMEFVWPWVRCREAVSLVQVAGVAQKMLCCAVLCCAVLLCGAVLRCEGQKVSTAQLCPERVVCPEAAGVAVTR